MLRRLAKDIRSSALRRRYADDYPRLIATRAIERPSYGYITYWAADLAKRLGVPKISVLEFGVAGGRGLLNLEEQAARVSELSGVGVEVYGFDTGGGLPPPADYRDLPYVWQESHFKMDQESLKARLKRAKLVLGLVRDTVGSFVENYAPAPIGAISFDLDYYSSTVDAFHIFDVPPEARLPRILCYFDDIMSSDLGHVGPAVGVPLAIDEFNDEGKAKGRVLSPLNHLQFAYRPAQLWHHQIYSFSDFRHPGAERYIVQGDRQLAI